jgi:hypothetical protein
MDPNDLFRNLRDAPSEDRTVYIRQTPYGPTVDFEVVERTSFEKAYPETTRELRTAAPLPCGHHVNKDNPIGGYCVICTQEYCSRCARICPRCGRSISSNCCAREFEGMFFCEQCRRTLRAQRAARICASFLLRPFLTDE